MFGYHGRFLKVDLGARTTEEMPLSEDDLKKYIGGATLAAALIYDHVQEGMDPLSPESPLIFATGPFTGSSIPMVSRYAVCGISPATGLWGEATSGGVFPFRLKGSGYDGCFITGRADNPVYLYVSNGSAEIRDASGLWGKDSYETQEALKKELGEENVSVTCIGSAGEKQLKNAGVMNDEGRAAGRCGLGALMGSKNLKAVAAGGRMRPESAAPEKVRALSQEAVATIRGNFMSVAYREYGTLLYMDMGMTLGDTPAKYYTQSVFEAEKVTGQALRQAYTIENYACRGCPIGCGRVVKYFKPDLEKIDGPEYETVAAFGPLCLNHDLETIIQANYICNLHGLDTISTGVSIAYAMYLYEQGVLTKRKAGLEIKWGDGQAILKLLEMIINQKGIGKILSQGTLAMAREFGRDEGEAAQVKGLEIPMHDGRAFHGLAVSYATGPRGACHLKGDYYNVELGGPIPELGIMPGDRLSSAGKAEPAAKYQSYKDLFDALTLCKFSSLSATQLAQILNALTGWEVSPEDLLTAGDRSINLKRAISNKLGLTREGDRLPKIVLQAYTDGNIPGQVPDMDLLLKDYYNYRKWDWETGRPTKEKLIELGLNHIAEDMYP
ncbi:MAG: aldehyde ferredoxin oxidoreductase family protein [Deltaproteobacteria bacterium]|nr:aldehyde ferredoxin oxidoreductase family protein [Deltaproteobacteria bacterium]MBW2085368.1 aldehyde ferredoxin oxidoreductase family protein [Deltaproteobacteria bacterium]